MTLFVLGINHTTAPVAVRERVAFSPEQMQDALQSLCDSTSVSQASILSTCNRTEIIGCMDAEGGNAEDDHEVLRWLASFHGVELNVLSQSSYSHWQEQAFAHISRVAAGLNSLILGEPQILGQMKSAYAVAKDAGTVRSELSKAFQNTFTTAKQIRTRTAIGSNPVSVAFAAVHLSKRIFSTLDNSTALLVGAGETIELVAKHLHEQGVRKLIVANRTLARGQDLAKQFGAKAVLLADIPEVLPQADIVISSTASQLPILGKGMVEKALKKRKHRPVFMVDIAVPRDIEEQVGELRDVYLYTVDDLQGIINENLKAREQEAEKAELIIDEAVEQYQKDLRSLDAVSTLRSYRQQAEDMRDEELEKAIKQLQNGTRAEEALSNLARTLTNKLIHSPSVNMKKYAAEGRGDLVEMSQQLLGIDPEEK